ncbi:hypothetical protein CMI37_22310 [Candidatus Pacearchaeota archaeon]|nr:hypothetical protein [Candidatus Pacearchaeota archaeon]|tara:strand:- start:406 stop:780 length:375 start_codon:yes stop_codon:yes gene_type:complete
MKNERINFATKLFQSKKGINDISIISVILAIFLITSVVIPFVNFEFGTEFSNLDEDAILQTARDDAESVSTISAFTVLKNVILLALFDVGDTLGLPIWLDIIYTLLAILFIIVIARNIWIGGGA